MHGAQSSQLNGVLTYYTAYLSTKGGALFPLVVTPDCYPQPGHHEISLYVEQFARLTSPPSSATYPLPLNLLWYSLFTVHGWSAITLKQTSIPSFRICSSLIRQMTNDSSSFFTKLQLSVFHFCTSLVTKFHIIQHFCPGSLSRWSKV